MPETDRGPDSSLNEHVFELRFRPNAQIIDFRGELAETISSHLGLPHWGIGRDRVDIFDASQRHRAFVSFRNLGYTVKDTSLASYFPDKAAKFLSYLTTLKLFSGRFAVQRVGVRSQFAWSLPFGFEEALGRITSRYCGLTNDATEVIGARIVDFNPAVNFRDEHGFFDTQFGAMTNEEVKRYLGGRDSYPDIALYYDIDYWRTGEDEWKAEQILQFLRTTARAGWERADKLFGLISTSRVEASSAAARAR